MSNSINSLNYVFKRIMKKLSFGAICAAGRNFSGAICVFHRGGGDKNSQHYVDFFRRLIALAKSYV
jgi:ribosomal protein L2